MNPLPALAPVWRRRLIVVGVVVLALVGAFSAGRFSAPVKTETRDVEHVVFKDKIVEVVKTVEKEAKVEARVVYRDRVITKDGTVTEHEVERSASKTEEKRKTSDDTTKTHAGETTRETVRTVTIRPSWRVGALVGASFQQPLLPVAGPLTLGLSAEYRIAGGLWVGLWTLPQHGAGGASLSFEF